MRNQFIGKTSRETGLSVDTIRFYEKVGLINPPARTGGKFRIFRAEDIHNLKNIRNLLDMGFSLTEIERVLRLRHGGMDVCTEVRDLLRKKVAKVRGKIRLLHRLEQEILKELQINTAHG